MRSRHGSSVTIVNNSGSEDSDSDDHSGSEYMLEPRNASSQPHRKTRKARRHLTRFHTTKSRSKTRESTLRKSNESRSLRTALLRIRNQIKVIKYTRSYTGSIMMPNQEWTLYAELTGGRLQRLERRLIISGDPDGACPPGDADSWICSGCKQTISIATLPSRRNGGNSLGYNVSFWLRHKLLCPLLQLKYRQEKAKTDRSGTTEEQAVTDCLCKLVCICDQESITVEKEDMIRIGRERGQRVSRGAEAQTTRVTRSNTLAYRRTDQNIDPDAGTLSEGHIIPVIYSRSARRTLRPEVSIPRRASSTESGNRAIGRNRRYWPF